MFKIFSDIPYVPPILGQLLDLDFSSIEKITNKSPGNEITESVKSCNLHQKGIFSGFKGYKVNLKVR